MNLNLTIYQNFNADRRVSMDSYSSNLYAELRRQCPAKTTIRLFKPDIPPLLGRTIGTGLWGMRFHRYLRYPLLAKRWCGQINHITEHGYAHILPALVGTLNVITVMDLIPLLAWRGEIQGMQYPHRPRFLEYSLRFLHRADRIITISEATRDDLVRLLGLDPDSITVIYPGLDHSLFRPLNISREKLASALGITLSQEFLLLISGREPYKNHHAALEVLAQLNARHPGRIGMLHLGRPYDELERKKSLLGVASLVTELGFVSDDKLPVAYNLANCLLFPSVYEGFGWPPIESMACGTPVVASSAGALKEVVGDLDTVCEPDNIAAMVTMIERLMDDESFRGTQIKLGHKICQKYTWEVNARETCALYAGLVNSKGRK